MCTENVSVFHFPKDSYFTLHPIIKLYICKTVYTYIYICAWVYIYIYLQNYILASYTANFLLNCIPFNHNWFTLCKHQNNKKALSQVRSNLFYEALRSKHLLLALTPFLHRPGTILVLSSSTTLFKLDCILWQHSCLKFCLKSNPACFFWPQ